MKKLFVIAAVLSSLSDLANATTINASVNGLVCSFCATGIEKTFKAEPAIQTVKVDLDKKLVTLTTKPSQDIDDAKVTKLLNDAGYSVVGIQRGE